MGDGTLSVEVNFVPAGPDDLTFYFYSPGSQSDNFVIFSVHRSGTLTWRNTIQVDRPPFDIKFNETVLETIVYMDDPENPPEGEAPKYFVIDRTGKLRN